LYNELQSKFMNGLKHIQTPQLQGLQKNDIIICSFLCNYIIFDIIFASNKTHHASHLNSAPGWVFDFYGGNVI
jgi:hypothetical protein